MSATETLESKYLSPARLAWVLDVCEDTVLREIARKRIDACKVGRLIRIPPEAALRYIARRTVRAQESLPFAGGARMHPDEFDELWRRIERLVSQAAPMRAQKEAA